MSETTDAQRSVTNIAHIANTGAAVWANKFVVSIGPIVRIAFLEQGGPDEPEFFRSAIAMSHQDAIALKNLLTSPSYS
jgi:hypothetical protein